MEVKSVVRNGFPFRDLESVDEIVGNVEPIPELGHYLEHSYDQVKLILDQNIDHRHLLNLEKYFSKFYDLIKNRQIPMSAKEELFRYMVLLGNVDLEKLISRCFSHQEYDAHLALELLEEISGAKSKWETRYSLVIWLSAIVRCQQDVSRLDTANFKFSQKALTSCKKYIVLADKSFKAAAKFCALLVTRKELKDSYLEETIHWAINDLNGYGRGNSWIKTGYLTVLSNIFKYGKYEDTVRYTSVIFDLVTKQKYMKDSYRLQRKTVAKLYQRIAICVLGDKVARWRYKKNVKLFAEKTPKEENLDDSNVIKDTSAEQCEAVPVMITKIVNNLLEAVCDNYISVRLSAAKGIRQIVGHLSAEYCEQIVSKIMSLFKFNNPYCAWNGGCLTLLDLVRHGLLLPVHLPVVIKPLNEALFLENINNLVSGNIVVREVACYTFWYIGKTYEGEILKDLSKDIINNLLIVALFDRELNCRKAAISAFHEFLNHHDLKIFNKDEISQLDYSAITQISTSYLKTSLFVAKSFPTLRKNMIDHLMNSKVGFWDQQIRELASKAMFKFTLLEPSYVKQNIGTVLQKFFGDNVKLKHGAVLCFAEIIRSLSIVEQNIKYDKCIVRQIKNLIPDFEICEIFSGKLGDAMKQACCELIVSCSIANFPVDDELIVSWIMYVTSWLTSENEYVRLAAASALSELLRRHYLHDEKPVTYKCDGFIEMCKERALTAEQETVRTGYVTALSYVPNYIINHYMNGVIECLITCAMDTDPVKKWTYAREATIKSISKIWSDFCCKAPVIGEIEGVNILKNETVRIVYVFLSGMSDYTNDEHGDVGSVVRKESLNGIRRIIENNNVAREVLDTKILEDIIIDVACLVFDRLSKIRTLACEIFVEMLHRINLPIAGIIKLRNLFPEKLFEYASLNKPDEVFSIFVRLLDHDIFFKSVFRQIQNCICAMNEMLSKNMMQSLTEYLSHKNEEFLENVCTLIVQDYERTLREGKSSKSCLIFLQRILNSSIFQKLLDKCGNKIASDIYNLVEMDVASTDDMQKLSISIDIFCCLLKVNAGLEGKCLAFLCKNLGHVSKWIRRTVSEKLAEALLLYGHSVGISDEYEQKIERILQTCDWENGSISDIENSRIEICRLLKIEL